MKQYNNIARTIFVLELVRVFSFTTGDGDDYSKEDHDYDTYFYEYDDPNIWEYDSRGSNMTYHGPIHLRGALRNQFALNVLTANPERSMTCSPVAVLLALGKLTLGAEKECLVQLLSALGLGKKAELKKGVEPLIKSLQMLKGVNLKMISKIYVNKQLRIRSTFESRAKKIFGSAVSSVDFRKPGAVARGINEYIRLMSKGLIVDTISEQDISPKSSLLLVNAVYFTGYWARDFKIIESTEFYTAHAIRHVSMMSRRDKFNYAKDDTLDSRLLEIPYAGGQTSLLIVLPNRRDALPALLDKIKQAPHLLHQAMEKMSPTDIIGTIPKFKAEIKMDLSDNFKKLGLTKMFRKRNSGLEDIVRDSDVHVSKCIHRIIINITDLCFGEVTSTADHIHPIPRNLKDNVFNANHPFLYFILFKHEQLFAGTLAG